MGKRKISKKVEQAAEKYLGSLGSSRTDLTNKQWEIIANYVKTERMKVPILLVFGVIFACLGFLYLQRAKSHIAYVVPDEVIFISKAGQEPSIPLKPDDIKEHIDYFTHGYFMTGSLFILTVFFFTFVFITIPLTRRGNKRMFEAFISHRQKSKTASPGNRMSLE